ncbi:MAG TPA: Bax inhibitor-1/YccA family protein [Ktedonobacteraceae bacterium]|nr:Bax inhibitor-1/YccA family protein [Ktedonobacteraceae bacterium]
MFNPRMNGPFGGRGGFGGRGAFASRYQYQGLPYANEQAGSLISKVMGLLAFSFLFAFIGAFVGGAIGLGFGGYWVVAIGGLLVLFILNFAINTPGLNLFLLYLFTFLEGMSLSPLLNIYLQAYPDILAEAFLITAVTSLGLAAYAWTTKRDFSRLGGILFMGVILLIVAGLVTFFFHSPFLYFIISVAGVGIFSAYVLFYVQRAKYMADTLPNAIGITVSLFITVLNLFLYILELLTILQGGNRGRR